MGTWALLLGLAALFVGLGRRHRPRRQHRSGALRDLVVPGGDRGDRRTGPGRDASGVRQAVRCPRHGSPPKRGLRGSHGRWLGANWSQNTAKRLEKAGNPPGWDPERILASKTLAALLLASVVGGLLWVGGRGGLQALLWGAAFGVFGFFLPDLLLHQQGPAPFRTDPEGSARQHRPAHDLRGVRARLRCRPGAGLPQHRRTAGRGVHPRPQGDPDRQLAVGGPEGPVRAGPTSTTFGSS